MKPDWKIVTLGELQAEGVADVQTGPFGTVLKASEYGREGVPVISVGEIREGYLHISERTPYVSDLIVMRLSKYVLSTGDIVFGRKGAIDRNAVINENQNGWFLGSDGIRLRLGETVNSRFVGYQLSSSAIGKWLHQNSTGSIMASLNQKIINRLPLWLPKLETQNNISSVLDSINAKIELNNKINAELEAMAKLIYDYWFVQFDFPHENGKPYKSSSGKMVYNEELKREIPAGWEVKEVNEIVQVKDGTHDSPKSQDSGYKLITSKHLKTEGLDFESANFISEEDYHNINKRSQVDKGDILFSMIGNIGTVYKIEEETIDFAIKNVALYKTSDYLEFKNYIYMYLRGHDMQRYMGNVIAGSIQKFIGLGSLRTMPLVYESKTVTRFEEKTTFLFEEMNVLKVQNQKLSELRDWLLPMLMNGQVKVK